MRNVCRMRIDVPSNGSKGKTAEICERATWAGVVKLKLMARERAGWFSSTSDAVVDATSLLKSDERDERDVREASRWTEGVDASKREREQERNGKRRREDRDGEKKAEERGSAHGSTEGKV